MRTLQEGAFAPMGPKHRLPIREACFSSMGCLRMRVEEGPRWERPKTWEERKRKMMRVVHSDMKRMKDHTIPARCCHYKLKQGGWMLDLSAIYG